MTPQHSDKKQTQTTVAIFDSVLIHNRPRNSYIMCIIFWEMYNWSVPSHMFPLHYVHHANAKISCWTNSAGVNWSNNGLKKFSFVNLSSDSNLAFNNYSDIVTVLFNVVDTCLQEFNWRQLMLFPELSNCEPSCDNQFAYYHQVFFSDMTMQITEGQYVL